MKFLIFLPLLLGLSCSKPVVVDPKPTPQPTVDPNATPEPTPIGP